MKEIKLINFRWNEPKCQAILRSLWINLLLLDQSWHFFWEGDYTVIRCQSSTAEEVTTLLKQLGIEHKLRVWEENIPITKKYQEEFTTMFHAFSELSMKMKNNEFMQILDRVCHCFLNNCRTISRIIHFHPAGDESSVILWEPLCLNAIASQRAYTIGSMAAGVYSKEVKEKLEEE